MSKNQTYHEGYDAYIIDVDMERPENNREVVVNGFTDRPDEQTNTLHDGAVVAHEVFLDSFVADQYHARLVENNCSLLIKTHTACGGWFFQNDAYVAAETTAKVHCNRVEQKRSVQRHAIKNNEKRKVKHLLLRFHRPLVNKYSPSGNAEDEIDYEIYDFEYNIQYPVSVTESKTMPRKVIMLLWRVAFHEDIPRAMGPSSSAGKTDGILGKLSGLTLGA